MPVINRVADLSDEVTAWRRDIHAHPELQYDVHRTAALVADKLRSFGCDEVATGIGQTGVVAVIRGKRGGTGRAIGLRADMDALPITETTGAPYASTVPGLMHACGHDGHTAMLLGAAKYLAETRNFDGQAVLIFQPAEEGGGGGLAMVEDGLFRRFDVQEVYGMHNWPGMPVGAFAIRRGPTMAAADKFDLVVTGRGGHAAHPHKNADPVVAAAQIVVALQSIASRNADPLDSVVVSVCTVRTAAETYNVIPQEVTLLGTVRTLTPEMRDLAERRIGEIAAGIGAAMGVTARLKYDRRYPVTFNHAEQADFMAGVAGAVGTSVTTDTPPQMGAEDFSYMLQERPGAYIFLGNGNTAECHNAAYDFSDTAIPFGVSLWAKVIEERLKAA